MENKNLGSEGMVTAIIISVVMLFLIIGGLIFIHFCILARTFRRGSRNGNGAMVERGGHGSSSLSRDEVEKLPCYDYIAKSSKGSSPVDCAVCLDNFKKGEKCRLLPICNHSFHAKCVDAWLLKNPKCPICRTDSRRFSEESSRYSDMHLLGEGLATESGEFSDVRIELGESQRTESGLAGDDVAVESRTDHHTNPAALPDSTLEHV